MPAKPSRTVPPVARRDWRRRWRSGQSVSSLTLASICAFSIDGGDDAARTMKPPSAASGTAMAMNSKHRLGGAVGRIEPQPEMDAQAAVQPDHQQQRALQDGACRPQPRELVEVVVLDAEVDVGDARIDDVGQQQERDQKPKADLEQLPGRKPQRRAPCELVEPERTCGCRAPSPARRCPAASGSRPDATPAPRASPPAIPGRPQWLRKCVAAKVNMTRPETILRRWVSVPRSKMCIGLSDPRYPARTRRLSEHL